MSKIIRPKVGLDVDGCFADFTYGFTRLAAEMGLVPAPWHCKDQDAWNFNHKEPARPPVYRFDDRPVWERLDFEYNWWMGLAPLVDTKEVCGVNELIYVADVYFITSRGASAGLSTEAQTAGWLRGINVDVDRATVIACSTAQKAPIATALRITRFLDDHEDNLVALRNAGVLAVARRWKYNEAWDGPWAASVDAFVEDTLEGIYASLSR